MEAVDMFKSVKDRVLYRIYSRGRGWAFSATDFTAGFERWKVDRSLADLAREGKIRRVIQGLYDYPMYSDILKKEIAPDIHSAADALARKYGWRIYPDGNTALNYLGLSTQIAAKHIYLSDGPSKRYEIGNRVLTFKHTSTKEAALKYANTALIIQAMKAAGEEQITDDFLKMLSQKYPAGEWEKIKKDASKTTGWVYKYISRIADNFQVKQYG
jgi:hypothetical protein